MSLTAAVVAIVKERGAVTVDQIRMEGYDREQVMQALKNARKRGLIESDGIEGGGRGIGRLPGVYRPVASSQPVDLASLRTTVQKVAAVIQGRGTATVDDLGALFPDLSRDQIDKALHNAKARGLVRLEVKGVGGPGKNSPGVWAAGHVRVGPSRHSNQPKRPANSPWEIGQDLRVSGWPPKSDSGRVFQLLGAWDEAEAA